MLAQIANIEAQLSFQSNQQPPQQQQQSQSWQPTSTFGHPTQAAASQGFPRSQPVGYNGQQQGQQGTQQQPGHQFSKDTDDRSIFVGNLPKGQNGVVTTPEELAAFFQDCGPILNCTVLKDKASGELKGTAYLEFATFEACGRAIDTKNNASFKGCAITVSKKRSLYRPGGARGGAPGGPRGRGGRGGNMFQADPMQAMMALMAMGVGMQQFMGGRGRGRGGGRGGRGGYPGGSGTGHNEGGGGFQPFQ